MPIVELFFNPHDQSVTFVPFARDWDLAGSRATGKSIWLSHDDFAERGRQVATELLVQHDTRDHRVPSELYNEMPSAVRRRFLRQHVAMNIAAREDANVAKVYAGPQLEYVGDIPLPFSEAFPSQMMAYFRDFR